ncbi:MAG: DUF885 domain-containing protein [Ferruginibacter sp.]
MRYLLLTLTISISTLTVSSQSKKGIDALSKLFNDFTEESYKLFPTTATSLGDTRYNDQLPATFTDSYSSRLRSFYDRYLSAIKKFNRARLNQNDKISFDIFKRNMEMSLEGLTLKINRVPFTQFTGLQLSMGQWGSGTGAQPFKTVKDYDDWISRATQFSAWADSAIIYFKKGITEKRVLPKSLVIKMIPQLDALQKNDITQSVFYGPVNKFPDAFSEADKARFTEAFKGLITDIINPSYKRLSIFLKNEYLPAARSSSGLTGFPEGAILYDYAIRNFTTTNKTPNEIFNTGLSEVKRIRQGMEKVRQQVNFHGSLDSFFVYTKTAPQFLPYKNAEEVLAAYRAIEKKIEPYLDNLFSLRPKTAFEVRQTEAFRAASAAAQYFSGLTNGTRPGIFYVPIVDATKYTTAKENLFIHEAIPGHHFQVMLQKENTALPKFRQDGGNSAYSEGWGLYCESLGKLLGCYTDPYQYFYSLGDEMHRAIRLVVDAGMHAKGWSREKAIEYMRSNEPITEQSATAEIERYMANPGQALSYKIGELKIKELRDKYSKQLGSKFKLSNFHDEFLRDGNMPLVTLEQKMDAWAKEVANKK